MELSMPQNKAGRLYLIRAMAEYVSEKCDKVRSEIRAIDSDSTDDDLQNAKVLVADILASAQDMSNMIEKETANLPFVKKDEDDDINGEK